MYLALKFEGDWSSHAKRHRLLVTLADEDGNDVFGIHGEFEMPAGIPGIMPECGIVFEFNQLQFPKPGDYRYYLQVDNEVLESSTLMRVQQIGS